MREPIYIVRGHEPHEWSYVFDENVIMLPEYLSIKLNIAPKKPAELVGYIDIDELEEKVRQISGDRKPYFSPIFHHLPKHWQSRIFFDKSGKRIFTFRQPQDILTFKYTPIRLGKIFGKEIPAHILEAWEMHEMLFSSETMITTDPEIWRAAYRDIPSCMQNRMEIEFYIDNPHAFEIGVIYSKALDKCFARSVIYKPTDGKRYYAKTYSNRFEYELRRFLEEQGVEYVGSRDLSLPECIAKEIYGIPYLDAFYFAHIKEAREPELVGKVARVVLHNNDANYYNCILRFTTDTKQLISNPCWCEGCGLMFPITYLNSYSYCENCEDYAIIECNFCDSTEIYMEGLCYDCYLEEYGVPCIICDNTVAPEREAVRARTSIYDYNSVDGEITNRERHERYWICVNCLDEINRQAARNLSFNEDLIIVIRHNEDLPTTPLTYFSVDPRDDEETILNKIRSELESK